MTALFFLIFSLLILAELIKGLSANGTPPVLQKFSWQLHLAHFMWSNILVIRLVMVGALIVLALMMPSGTRSALLPFIIGLGAAWGFIYWLFNHFWVGRKKFLPLEKPAFAKNATSNVEPEVQVMGVDLNGVQKAYPVAMIYYHHQVPDHVGAQPVWVTYCGLCRSGRVYDREVDGQALDFTLVGAINYNAIFRDHQTGSWWRQELGEAAKGPKSGTVLEDVPMEQMSLANWIEKHPDTEILQYDPKFQQAYDFRNKLMAYEASLPGWHMQETPPLVIGIDLGGEERAYDWEQVKKKRMVMDELGGTLLLLLSSEDGSSPFVYNRSVDGKPLDFEIDGDALTDKETGSKWDIFGRCVEGELKGSSLDSIQYYQQFLRAWVTFHPNTSFYSF